MLTFALLCPTYPTQHRLLRQIPSGSWIIQEPLADATRAVASNLAGRRCVHCARPLLGRPSEDFTSAALRVTCRHTFFSMSAHLRRAKLVHTF